jgi:cell division septal protein FtsQ
VDYRLAARRRQVAEVHARSRFSKLIWALVLGAVAALSVWLFRSPILAIHEVRINGIEGAELAAMLVGAGVEEGKPLVSIRPTRVEEALLSDPRIKEATVTLEWPQRVVVEVVQRRPVAWANVEGSWALVGGDGVALETAAQPASGHPRLEVGWDTEPGADAIGGLAFLSELDPLIGSRTTVIAVSGELWALIDGVNVRLGRPIGMESKARALEAVLAQGVPAGATVNLIAPARPAVSVPSTDVATDLATQPPPNPPPDSQAQVKP